MPPPSLMAQRWLASPLRKPSRFQASLAGALLAVVPLVLSVVPLALLLPLHQPSRLLLVFAVHS
jgi:hypothetical protein